MESNFISSYRHPCLLVMLSQTCPQSCRSLHHPRQFSTLPPLWDLDNQPFFDLAAAPLPLEASDGASLSRVEQFLAGPESSRLLVEAD